MRTDQDNVFFLLLKDIKTYDTPHTIETEYISSPMGVHFRFLLSTASHTCNLPPLKP